MTDHSIDEALERLDDLQHDLGKYIHLPLSFLPQDASDAMVRDALDTAIYRTRRSVQGTQSAQDIWDHFHQDAGNLIRRTRSWSILVDAVEKALAWGPKAHQDNMQIDRERLMKDLRSVSRAIAQIQDEIDE